MKQRQDDLDDGPLDAAGITEFRSLAALANYISLDRVDICFAVKELAQRMAGPGARDLMDLKRLARYIREFPVCKSVFRWQRPPSEITVLTDSDWGGCDRTRRSTSGGCIMLGCHLILHWSRTQQSVSLSSCEAEVNALNKGGTEGLGVKYMLGSCGVDLRVVIKTDASAARGVVERAGAGKVKHLSVKQLWGQDQIAPGNLQVDKILGDQNLSDLMTHHHTESEAAKFFPALAQIRTSA